MAARSALGGGDGENRSSRSRRSVSSIMFAWVRRALTQVATRPATRAAAITRNATANARLMLGVRRPGAAGASGQEASGAGPPGPPGAVGAGGASNAGAGAGTGAVMGGLQIGPR